MTKEQLYVKWLMTPDLKSDLEAVIATEVAKVQEVKPKPEYICYKCENKTNNKFAICDKCNIGWNEPEQETVEPALNPIAEAYERGKRIKRKKWAKNEWYKKHTNTHMIDNNGIMFLNPIFEINSIKNEPYLWELYTEPARQVTEQEQPTKPFDRDRFEAMFRAVIETHEATMNALKQLDAYYGTKQGGENE